jgi:hypothetical protein
MMCCLKAFSNARGSLFSLCLYTHELDFDNPIPSLTSSEMSSRSSAYYYYSVNVGLIITLICRLMSTVLSILIRSLELTLKIIELRLGASS